MIHLNIDNLCSEAIIAVESVNDLHSLEQIHVHYLGKKGKLTEILKSLSSFSADERPKVGQIVNSAKEKLLQIIKERENYLKLRALEASLAKEAIDITLPGRGQGAGSIHPVTKVRKSLEMFFTSLGFSIAEGPEIEDEYHNFTALNIPKHHPARAAHDTFYFDDGSLLRTHTSPVQIRAMHGQTPPIKIIAPGRVYRCDYDATHSPMFNQLEVFMIDENINFANLKWLLYQMLEYFFDKKVEIRFRPSYFSFTEPSAEVDLAWELDGQTKWLEILGCGMIHPNVLKECGIDSERYTGFAFGLGLDRLAMLRYGIKDLRIFFESDLSFLEQF
jgi:phenylalanyl-tRNA synthetase alpha chain